MSNIEKYLKELEEMKSAPGFKQKDFSVSTSNGQLNMSLHGPTDFLAEMPTLIETVAKATYNQNMFTAIAKANKPVTVIHTDKRSLLGAAPLHKPLAWYCLLCVKEVSQLLLLFNTLGYDKTIPFECKQGDKIIQKQKLDDVKYTLAHEFFHLWHFVDPGGTPKKGGIARTMYSPPLRNECWATRYTNGWRNQERRCVRYIYQYNGKNHHVDSIRNY